MLSKKMRIKSSILFVHLISNYLQNVYCTLWWSLFLSHLQGILHPDIFQEFTFIFSYITSFKLTLQYSEIKGFCLKQCLPYGCLVISEIVASLVRNGHEEGSCLHLHRAAGCYHCAVCRSVKKALLGVFVTII